MKKEFGFTLIQTAVTVAITGALALVAVPLYQNYIAKAQAAEIQAMLTSQQVNAITNLKNGTCPSLIATGKFGTVVSSGTFTMRNGASCQTGCELKYQFKNDGVAKDLKGKAVTVALLNSGKISTLDPKTNIPAKYLNGLVVSSSNLTGDNCTKVTPTQPLITTGNMPEGNEVGAAAPVPPAPATPPETGGGSGTGATPAGPTIPYAQQLPLGDALCFYDKAGRAEYMACIIVSLDGKKILARFGALSYDQGGGGSISRSTQRSWDVAKKGGACWNKYKDCYAIEDYTPDWTTKSTWWTGRKLNKPITRYTNDQKITR